MARTKGGTHADKAAHLLFDVACGALNGTGGRNYGHHCPRCGTILLTAYHEERLYSVHCPTCCVVSLVKARNPTAAEAQVAGHNQEGSA